MRMNIEAERARAGMTTNELSEKLGISQKTYVKYVNGSPISSDVLEKMAELFNCSIDYLLGILAAEMIALGDEEVAKKVDAWKAGLGAKIEKANKDLAEVKYDYKCN